MHATHVAVGLLDSSFSKASISACSALLMLSTSFTVSFGSDLEFDVLAATRLFLEAFLIVVKRLDFSCRSDMTSRRIASIWVAMRVFSWVRSTMRSIMILMPGPGLLVLGENRLSRSLLWFGIVSSSATPCD